MPLLSNRLRSLSTFFILLGILLVFNLYFSFQGQWFGISLFMRIFISVFCFYLIFTFSTANLEAYETEYLEKFGKKGEQILFLLSRGVPFFIIYCIIIVFTLIDFIPKEHWPWNPVMSLLNGQYANILIYSLFLLFVIKLRKDPFITIPIFLVLCILYFAFDRGLSSVIQSSSAHQVVLILKFIIFFFFLFVEFFVRRSPIKMFTTAVIVSLIFYVFYIGCYHLIYNHSPVFSYAKKESGIKLLRLGFNFPLSGMKEYVLKNPDPVLFGSLSQYAGEYDNHRFFSQKELENLLFSGDVEMTELVSEHIIQRKVKVPFEKIIGFTYEKSEKPGMKLHNAPHFVELASISLDGKEELLIKKMQDANNRFIHWSIAVLGRQARVEFIPMLITYLTHIDTDLAEASYIALCNITGFSPREELNKRINDPDVIIKFRQYYLQNRKGN